MMRQMLYLQWKAARWVLAPFIVLAFALPVLAVRTATSAAATGPEGLNATILVVLQIWSPIFPLLALLVGVAVGLTAWSWDHSTNHVYALALPVQRWEYAVLKMGAGAMVLLLPVVAAWLGALVASLSVTLPTELHAYPTAFGVRFLIAALVTYGAAFALAAGTVRTTAWLVIGVVVFLVFGTFLAEFLRDALRLEAIWTPLDVLHAALVRWPGPFHVFGGNWMLIDV